MKTYKWLISLLAVLLATLLLFAGMMYAIDPLLRYGKEKEYITYYEYSEIYSNPGIARNYEYDAVMVGTSMIENTNVEECNELFKCNMVRLPYSGGTSYNMKRILDICFESDNTIKTVYWNLDEFQLLGDHAAPRYPLPEYLYSNSHIKDLSYLLNLDIFYHYAFLDVINTLQKKQQPAARTGETLFGDYDKDSMLLTYSRPEISESTKSFEDVKETVDNNLNNNILPLIRDNPDTEFVFFMVPYSILYWDKEIRNGSFESTMDAVEYSMEQILAFENTKIYFYHNEPDIICNLDNYKDYSHYGTWINSFMTESMAKDYGRVDKNNYKEVISEMKDFVYGYDFDKIFE